MSATVGAVRAVTAGILAVGLALGLAGCSQPAEEQRVLTATGTGSHAFEVTIARPGAGDLTLSFFCSSGSYHLVVRESPATAMIGRCGTAQTFVVPIPPVHTVHLEIGLRQDSIYTMRAGFRS